MVPPKKKKKLIACLSCSIRENPKPTANAWLDCDCHPSNIVITRQPYSSGIKVVTKESKENFQVAKAES